MRDTPLAELPDDLVLRWPPDAAPGDLWSISHSATAEGIRICRWAEGLSQRSAAQV